MKKKISCALLALLLAGQVMGAVSVEATRTETGYQTKELLVPQFEDCMGISDDGILAVRKGDKWGFVDVNGQTLLDYKYDYVTPMRDGIAVIGYKSEKDPYVDKETGKSYDYYILYLVDKTGKETQLFVVEEQQYRIDMFPTDANGNHYVELHQNGWSNINIENGVVQINDYLFYKYDGTPIYAKDQEKLNTTVQDAGMLGADSLDIYMLSASKEGVIPVSMSYSFIAYSPLIAYMDLDGNVVRTFPIMGKGKTLMDFDSHNFENTAEEFGICYAYAPENGYTVAYNQHYMNYINRDGDPVPTPGYGVLNAEGEWVIEPIYKNARRDYDQPLNDGYISLQNQDGLWGIMNVEGEIVIPFEYYNATPMINGYTLLGKAENDVGVITDSNGQTYTITDSHNNPLEIEALYLTNATNNVRRIETTDGKTYLLSGTPNGTNFKTIWNTENMPLTGHRSPSGEYWLTHTDDGYGVIQVKTVNYIIDDTAQTTAPDSEEKSEEVAEETKETAEETETQPTTNKHFPIRGNSAAKQFRRSSFSGKGLSPMVRH